MKTYLDLEAELRAQGCCVCEICISYAVVRQHTLKPNLIFEFGTALRQGTEEAVALSSLKEKIILTLLRDLAVQLKKNNVPIAQR